MTIDANTLLAWTAGARKDAEEVAQRVCFDFDLGPSEVRIRPSHDGNGWEVWTR